MSDPVSEAGKVAGSAVDALRGSPTCLAVIILAAFFGALTFFAYQRDADRRSKTTDVLLERCYAPLHENEANIGRPH